MEKEIPKVQLGEQYMLLTDWCARTEKIKTKPGAKKHIVAGEIPAFIAMVEVVQLRPAYVVDISLCPPETFNPARKTKRDKK